MPIMRYCVAVTTTTKHTYTHTHTGSATNNVGFCVGGIFEILPVYFESMIGILTRCLPIGSARECLFINFFYVSVKKNNRMNLKKHDIYTPRGSREKNASLESTFFYLGSLRVFMLSVGAKPF